MLVESNIAEMACSSVSRGKSVVIKTRKRVMIDKEREIEKNNPKGIENGKS